MFRIMLLAAIVSSQSSLDGCSFWMGQWFTSKDRSPGSQPLVKIRLTKH